MMFRTPTLTTADNRSEFYQSFKINKDDDVFMPIEIKTINNVDINNINILLHGDGFIMKNNTCTSTLKGKESCTITLDFKRQGHVSYGKYCGKVEIKYNSKTLTLKLIAEVIPNLTYEI